MVLSHQATDSLWTENLKLTLIKQDCNHWKVTWLERSTGLGEGIHLFSH